ncbi:MAG TPA: ribonucleotide reductase N-terminal alpha domain-containing protein, partial [Rhodanobacter sp.]|nr:ribonucleotide reductase N-terminal alpha domain-containing protein [Rhodanobacter sp.]
MSTVRAPATHPATGRDANVDIPLQPASQDIWDKKYRLKAKSGEPVDATIDETYQRVARALAEVEATDELRGHWYERFLWALRRGAIPAGRIISNAGALAHKPATSTINCTVSGTIHDSMDDILQKVHEAGLTLKSGCGIGYEFSTLRPRNAYVSGAGAYTSGPLSFMYIYDKMCFTVSGHNNYLAGNAGLLVIHNCGIGYEFSTLRPRGAYVSGAGAYTSGPLSFMDIYDKMCFTVSSAGGRRGAQMGTFDISHPDAKEFIRAKREDGRLRQFNLSLLITDGFMDAVETDADWPLVFPVHVKEQHEIDLDDAAKVVWRDWPTHKNYVVRDDGLTACKIYGHIRARHLWDMIMVSTYDYAEPGFILIDRVNEMNNNWWCEHIRATNPCVTADTRLATQYGMVPIGELYAKHAPLEVTVDRRALGEHAFGAAVRPAVPAFMTSASADVYRVVTQDGYEIKATQWHDFYTQRGKIKLKDLKPGDDLLIQSGKGQFGRDGNEQLGLLLGL